MKARAQPFSSFNSKLLLWGKSFLKRSRTFFKPTPVPLPLFDKAPVFATSIKSLKPNYLTRWQELHTNSEVIEFPNAGHFVQEEQPIEVSAAVRRFLSRT
jgi:pimeloyl-ACP methyl ester carboxylesterase